MTRSLPQVCVTDWGITHCPGGGGGGGDGTLNILWWGCAAVHPKKGGLRHGYNLNREVLGTARVEKKGVLGIGTIKSKGGGGGGGLRNWSCKKDNLSN